MDSKKHGLQWVIKMDLQKEISRQTLGNIHLEHVPNSIPLEAKNKMDQEKKDAPIPLFC